MSGYVEAGYVIALGSLSAYAVSLVVRERAARSRLPQSRGAATGATSTARSGGTGDQA
ncbi:MAG: hypothetical protein ABSD78_00745 [Acidimicrobiales bacterium]|jgi:hypothetical protein